MLGNIESMVRDGNVSNEVLTLWTGAELEFYQTLIEPCGTGILKITHAVFFQQLITTDGELFFVPGNIKQHQDILDAALAQDEDLARHRIHETCHAISSIPYLPSGLRWVEHISGGDRTPHEIAPTHLFFPIVCSCCLV